MIFNNWRFFFKVSRTAPTGEYLTPGSFMIRGKKNFLPSCQLQMGFGLMFKLADESISAHANERSACRAANDIIEEEVFLSSDSENESKNGDEVVENFPDIQVYYYY